MAYPWERTTITNSHFDGKCSLCKRRLSMGDTVLTQERTVPRWLMLCDFAIERNDGNEAD